LAEATFLGGGRRESAPFEADGATMFDALTLLASAFESAATTGVPPSAVEAYRVAVRDAFAGLPARTLAAGRYDARMDATVAVLAEGTVSITPSRP